MASVLRSTKVLRRLALLTVIALPQSVFAAEAAHEAHGGGHVDYSSLIFYAINFAMYLVVMSIIYRRKVAPLLEQRAIAVKQELERAALGLSRAEEDLAILQRRLKLIEGEKTELLEGYEREAKRMGDAVNEAAEIAARRIVSDTERQVESELSQARKTLRREAVLKAIELARKKVSSGFSAEDDRRLRNQVLRDTLF